jgi:hypothetical protein
VHHSEGNFKELHRIHQSSSLVPMGKLCPTDLVDFCPLQADYWRRLVSLRMSVWQTFPSCVQCKVCQASLAAAHTSNCRRWSSYAPQTWLTTWQSLSISGTRAHFKLTFFSSPAGVLTVKTSKYVPVSFLMSVCWRSLTGYSWNLILPKSSFKMNWHFWDTWCLQFQGWRISHLRN